MKVYRFYKNEIGWFIDLPEWGGDVSDLQMVSGADTFLDIISSDFCPKNKCEVTLAISTEPFNNCNVLNFQSEGLLEGPEMGSGSWYVLNQYMGLDVNIRMWLCDVTKHIFGNFPNKIYFK